MAKLNVLTVVGARPQFIKLAPVSRAFRKRFNETVLHTGQHFDDNMSQVFFDEMKIPKPDIRLDISGGSHGQQTGRLLESIEAVILENRPDVMVVFGDTNTTLAAALAAAKLHIPICHIEAGLRSFDPKMPEEINRILTDNVSKIRSATSDVAIKNLAAEGITDGVYLHGDVMFDALKQYRETALAKNSFEKQLSHLAKYKGRYALLTLHRASNTDNQDILSNIMQAIEKSDRPYVFPIHPRTRKMLDQFNIPLPKNCEAIDPVGYLEMIELLEYAQCVVTDSGGVQKEALFANRPCVTLRDTTEWVETVETQMNILVLDDANTLNEANFLNALNRIDAGDFPKNPSNPYGDGDAAEKIADTIETIICTD